MSVEPVGSVGALLVAALLGDGAPIPDGRLRGLSRRDWSDVLPAANHHRVLPAVHLALRESELAPVALRATLADVYDASVHFHLLCTAMAARSVDAFREQGIRCLVVKGPVLAEGLYPRPDLRSYGDLDLLVDRRRFGDAVRTLEAAGGSVVERNWDLVLHLLKGELNVALPAGVTVDLHWSLLYDEGVRRQFDWVDDEWLAPARVIAGGALPTLDIVDEAVHLCVHGCLAGAHRLAWLDDVRRAVHRPGLDIHELVARAQARRVGELVAVMADRVAAVFGTTPVLAALAASSPSAWRRVLRSIQRVRPPVTSGPRMSGHLLVASTRPTWKQSMGQARAAVRAGFGELVHDPDHPWRKGQSTRSAPHPMIVPVMEEGGREAFIAAVEHQHLGRG